MISIFFSALCLFSQCRAAEMSAPSHDRLKLFIEFADADIGGLEPTALLPILESTANPFVLHKLIEQAPYHVPAFIKYCLGSSSDFAPTESYILDCQPFLEPQLFRLLESSLNENGGPSNVQTLFELTMEIFSGHGLTTEVRKAFMVEKSIQGFCFVVVPDLYSILVNWDNSSVKGKRFEEQIILPAYLKWFAAVCKKDLDDPFWSSLLHSIQDGQNELETRQLLNKFVRRVTKSKKPLYGEREQRILALVSAMLGINEETLVRLLRLAGVKDTSSLISLNATRFPF